LTYFNTVFNSILLVGLATKVFFNYKEDLLNAAGNIKTKIFRWEWRPKTIYFSAGRFSITDFGIFKGVFWDDIEWL